MTNFDGKIKKYGNNKAKSTFGSLLKILIMTFDQIHKFYTLTINSTNLKNLQLENMRQKHTKD